MDSLEHCPSTKHPAALSETLNIPLWHPSKRKEAFHFSCHEKSVVHNGVVERLDTIPVPRANEHLPAGIPQDQSKFAPKVGHKRQPVVLIESQDDLAVASTMEVVFAAQELSVVFVIVQLAIHDRVDIIRTIMKGLIRLRAKINNGESNVAQI